MKIKNDCPFQLLLYIINVFELVNFLLLISEKNYECLSFYVSIFVPLETLAFHHFKRYLYGAFPQMHAKMIKILSLTYNIKMSCS